MQSHTADPPERVQQLCTLARLRIAAGDYDGARTYLLAARAMADTDPPPNLLRLLADLTAQLESFASGVTLMERALDGFRIAEDLQGEVITAADLAALLQRQGNLGRARTLIEWALTHNWLCQALYTMQVSGYGTTLLWQPRRFAELCTWSLERDIEVTHAAWLLQTSLAPWYPPASSTICDKDDQLMRHTNPYRLQGLTDREREVLMLAAEGLRDREIAARLHVSVRTVQNHLQRCYEKLDVHTRAAAIRLWLERGVLRQEAAD